MSEEEEEKEEEEKEEGEEEGGGEEGEGGEDEVEGGEEDYFQKFKQNRRPPWIGHTVRQNEFAVNILEGAIFGKKAVGRPGLQYLK